MNAPTGERSKSEASVAMALPILTMAWAAVGGWEERHIEANKGSEQDDELSNDAWAMVILHVVVIALPLGKALHVLASSVYVWRKTKNKEAPTGIKAGLNRHVGAKKPVKKSEKKKKKKKTTKKTTHTHKTQKQHHNTNKKNTKDKNKTQTKNN